MAAIDKGRERRLLADAEKALEEAGYKVSRRKFKHYTIEKDGVRQEIIIRTSIADGLVFSTMERAGERSEIPTSTASSSPPIVRKETRQRFAFTLPFRERNYSPGSIRPARPMSTMDTKGRAFGFAWIADRPARSGTRRPASWLVSSPWRGIR
jgi:hypothetical protein